MVNLQTFVGGSSKRTTARWENVGYIAKVMHLFNQHKTSDNQILKRFLNSQVLVNVRELKKALKGGVLNKGRYSGIKHLVNELKKPETKKNIVSMRVTDLLGKDWVKTT